MHTRFQTRNLHNQQHQAPPPIVEQFNLEEPVENPEPLAPMDDTRTMAQLLEAPTAGYEEGCHRCCHEIAATTLSLSTVCLNLVQKQHFFGHDKGRSYATSVFQTESFYVEMKFHESSVTSVFCRFAELKDMVKALLLDKKNQSPAPTPVKAVEESCVTCGGAHSYQTCPATTGKVVIPPAYSSSRLSKYSYSDSRCMRKDSLAYVMAIAAGDEEHANSRSKHANQLDQSYRYAL
ncbi:hypothetical protein Tco_1132816 [Tanacetum coccineum]|uniref:Uncharacterized protein n=1 Tax=Tanacetum coccineum TaxID=301880 RepID=A0ABQ5JED4_9ASTR